MATNLTIDLFYQTKYDSLWRHLIQQQTNRLRAYTTVRPCKGKMVLFDQLGLLDFDEKTTRMAPTVVNEVPGQKRALTPREFARAYGFDEFDASKLADADVPITETTQAFAFAAGRKMEKLIIQGIEGTNYEGENGATAVSFDTTNNKVAHGGANMTWDKVTSALTILMRNDAWGQDAEGAGDTCVLALGSSQLGALLTDATLTTADQAQVRQLLADGSGFATIHGIRIVRTEQLTKVGATRNCYMWVKSQCMFGIWEDYRLKLSVRDDLDETIQLRARFSANACRMQENAFVLIECNE